MGACLNGTQIMPVVLICVPLWGKKKGVCALLSVLFCFFAFFGGVVGGFGFFGCFGFAKVGHAACYEQVVPGYQFLDVGDVYAVAVKVWQNFAQVGI